MSIRLLFTVKFFYYLVAIVSALALFGVPAAGQVKPIRGPLRVSKLNPRYFTDDSGRAIYLAGSHTWNNLQENALLETKLLAPLNPPPIFNYEAYLGFLQNNNMNFTRLWRIELPSWVEDYLGADVIRFSSPHPWVRSGPGAASDGGPKFNLEAFNQDYFDRLRSRVAAARDKDIYVGVMLFEGWGVQFAKGGWRSHPFNGDNNVNGLEADANRDGVGLEYFTLTDTDAGKRVL